MLVKFIKKSGKSIYVRAEDIRIIDDQEEKTRLAWLVGNDVSECFIQGTADENYARLSEEERQRAAEYETLRQQRAMQQLGGLTPIGPDPRVERGRPKR